MAVRYPLWDTSVPPGATEPPLSRRRGREIAVRAETIICTGRGRRRHVGETTASLSEWNEGYHKSNRD